MGKTIALQAGSIAGVRILVVEDNELNMEIAEYMFTERGACLLYTSMSLHELELVSQVSDRILCVRGEYADRYGTPEEILQEEYICGLFGIPKELQRSDLGKEILSSIPVSYTHLDVYKRQGWFVVKEDEGGEALWQK